MTAHSAGVARGIESRASLLWTRASALGVSGFLPVGLGLAAAWGLRALLGVAAVPIEVCLGVAILLGLCVAPMVRSARRSEGFDLFELGVGFGGVYFLYFGLRALVLLVDPGILTAQSPHPSVILAALPQAVWYADLGMAAYLAGYRVSRCLAPLKERVFTMNAGVDARLVVGAAVVVYTVGWLARMPELTRGWFVTTAASRFAAEIPPTVQTVSYFSILGVFGYALSLLALFVPGGDRPIPRLVAATFTPLELFYAFLIGSKFHVGMVVTMLLIIPHYLRRRISPRAVLVTILVFVFAITPLVTVYRGVAAAQDIPLRKFAQQLPQVAAAALARLGAFTPGQYLETSVHAFTDRLSGIDGLALTLRGVPLVIGYIRGESLAWVFRILVPTIVHPDKNIPLAQVLGPVPRLFGFLDARNGGIAITSVAEFYWNFGTAGVLVGMGLVGVVQGAVVAVLRRPTSPFSVFVYAVLWPWMMLAVEGWAYAVYGNALRLGVLAALISLGTLWLGRWRRSLAVEVERATP